MEVLLNMHQTLREAFTLFKGKLVLEFSIFIVSPSLPLCIFKNNYVCHATRIEVKITYTPHPGIGRIF